MQMKFAYVGIDLFYAALPALGKEGEIVKIFTCNTDNITEFNLQICQYAEQNHIALQKDRITLEDIHNLVHVGCNVIVCAGYYYRIPIDDSIPIINIHPALLPKGRGAWPMPVTILKGLRESGVTFHKMVNEFDAGDILLQKRISVDTDETLETLTQKMNEILPEMIANFARNFDELYLNAVPQGMGETWKCPKEEEYLITSQMSIEETDLILRAFYGYECIYQADGRIYSVFHGRCVSGSEVKEGSLPVIGGHIEAERIRELC